MKRSLFPAAVCRLLALLLCVMLLPFAPAAAAGENVSLDDYLRSGFDMQDLFDAAEKALDKGADPKAVLEEMSAAVNDLDALEYLDCAIGNIMADANPETKDITKLVNGRKLSIETSSDYDFTASPRYSIYDTPSVSDSVKAMLGKVKGNACLEPAFWSESDFTKIFNTKPEQFKPAEPRPAHVCVVIRDKTQAAPEEKWKKDLDAITETLEQVLNDLTSVLEDDQPVYTGNPQLASSLWIIEIRYPLRGRYGEDGKIKGYNISLTLSVLDTKTHKQTAELKHTEVLPNTIWEWDNWIAKAELPGIYNSDDYMAKFRKWAKTVRPLLKQERSTAAAGARITGYNAEKVLNALLVRQTEKLTDAWQKAIYTAGAKNISVEDGSLSFTLRSFDPKLSDLGARAKAEDPEQWLQTALENATAYDLAVSLPLENGTVPQKGINTLKTAVQKAAAAAKSAFGSKDMTTALKDALFPLPYEGELTSSTQLRTPTKAFADWYDRHSILPGYDVPCPVAASVLAYRKVQNVNVQGGPHAITFTCAGESLKDLGSDSISKVTDEQAFLPASQREVNDPQEALVRALTIRTASSMKKVKAKTEISVDLDTLAGGSLPAEYKQMFTVFRWEDLVDKLSDTLSNLPDEAAKDMPKNGIIKGGKSGTTVVFRAGDQTNPTYLIMRDTSTDKIAVSAMLYPKKSVTVRVPKGKYEIAWCSGPYWFGTKVLFGALGQYNKSETVKIRDKNYRHTFTLKAAKDDGVSFYDANPEDFR